MDNQESEIVVGQNVPFRTGQTATGTDGTTNPFTTIERQDVGLTLRVTPVFQMAIWFAWILSRRPLR